MKAYKASYNLKCESLTYEVGKTYEIDNMEMCESGFHFCKEMKDILTYYVYNKEFILMEIEILGDVEDDGTKSVTNKMKVLRIIPPEEYTFDLPLKGYDENNNLIYYKNLDGYEEWNEYDENNNKIHSKDSGGFEWWKEYDSNGNVIHYEYSDGTEVWKEYDDNGNVIHTKESNGNEWRITITD